MADNWLKDLASRVKVTAEEDRKPLVDDDYDYDIPLDYTILENKPVDRSAWIDGSEVKPFKGFSPRRRDLDEDVRTPKPPKSDRVRKTKFEEFAKTDTFAPDPVVDEIIENAPDTEAQK